MNIEAAAITRDVILTITPALVIHEYKHELHVFSRLLSLVSGVRGS